MGSTTYCDMKAHLENLQWASRNLLHAVIDDGCSCSVNVVRSHSGKYDHQATRDRDSKFVKVDRRPWGISNPHTLWGDDVLMASAVLYGTPHEFSAIWVPNALFKIYSWPHIPLSEVALGGEVDLAHKIDALEPALNKLLDGHVKNTVNYGDDVVSDVLNQLKDSEYSYGT